MDDNWIVLGLIAWGGLGLLLLLVFMYKDRAGNRHRKKKEKEMTVAGTRTQLSDRLERAARHDLTSGGIRTRSGSQSAREALAEYERQAENGQRVSAKIISTGSRLNPPA